MKLQFGAFYDPKMTDARITVKILIYKEPVAFRIYPIFFETPTRIRFKRLSSFRIKPYRYTQSFHTDLHESALIWLFVMYLGPDPNDKALYTVPVRTLQHQHRVRSQPLLVTMLLGAMSPFLPCTRG
jgi:hypothetical protein